MAIDTIPQKFKEKTMSCDKVVLLLAAMDTKKGVGKGSLFTPNYKLMSTLSGQQYTPSSLEHQFRDLRKAAAELLDANPNATDEDGIPSTPRKRE